MYWGLNYAERKQGLTIAGQDLFTEVGRNWMKNVVSLPRALKDDSTSTARP